MNLLIAYLAALLGILSFPGLFIMGLYLLLKRVLAPSCTPLQRWSAAAVYSLTLSGAWWVLYLYGVPLQPYFPLPSLAFAYGAYALLPVSLAFSAATMLGTLVCIVTRRTSQG